MKKIKQIILPLITISLLCYLFSRFDIKEILNIYLNSNELLLALSIIIILSIPFISAFRWKKIINTLDYDVPYKTTLKAFWASIPLSKITPGSSGDFIRSYYLKNKIPASQGIGIILFERLLDVGVIALLSFIGGIINNYKIAELLGLSFFSAILLFLFIAPKIKINNKKWKLKINNLFLIFNKAYKSKVEFAKILFYTIIQWLLVILFVFIAFLSMDIDINFLKVLTIQPIVILTSLLPFTISGIGTREASMIFLYKDLVSANSALAVGIMYSFLGNIILSLVGLPFMVNILKNSNYKKPKNNEKNKTNNL